jgi:hypothetical protein
VGGKVIVVGVVGLVIGFVGGAVAAWGLDPADEPEQAERRGTATFVVFIEPDLSDAEVAAVETELQDDPRIDELVYLDREESTAKAREVFADDDEMLDRLEEDVDVMPTSFQFVLPDAEEAVVQDLITDLRDLDGVVRAVVTLSTRAVATPGEPILWN